MSLNGIDVSASGQGLNFPWQDYKGRVQFAGIKISDGLTYADPAAKHNIACARELGLFVIGYHFTHANLSGSGQAEWFLKCAELAGLHAGDALAFDYEDAGLAGEGYGQMNLTAGAAVGEVHRHWAAYNPLCYTEISMAPELASVASCPLWLADLNDPLTTRVGPWGLVSIWQTGQRGVDTDTFNGSLAELKKLAVP